jgi:fucose permease
VTTLTVGPLLDRFGHKPPLLIAPLFVAAALVLVAQVSTFTGLIAAVVLLGIGGGALNQVTNTLVADLYSDVRAKSAALNLLGVFFGIGALFIPFTVGAALHTLGLAPILYLAMALSLLPVVLSLPFAFPAPHHREGVSAGRMLQLARQPLVLAFSFLLFFESGNEFILGGYVTTYLTGDLRATVSTASYLLAAYWGSLMLGRIILSRVALRSAGGTLVRASALGVAIGMAWLLAIHSVTLALFCVILMGFSIAAIFPTVLGLAGARYPSHSGTVFGILIGIALTGGMTMPWLAGRIAGVWSIRRALFLVVLNALAIFILQWIAGNISRRQGNA